jgi:hypothetical protein
LKQLVITKLHTTFGGMCSCLRVAVARVIALVVRMLGYVVISLFSRCKNRDTRRGLRGDGAGRTASHKISSLARRLSRYGEAIALPDCLHCA